jgi:quinone-modifying oxidoreductase subunit QmoA
VESEFDDEYNYGLKKRKAAYLPFNQAYPERYVLDPRAIGTPDADKAKAACKYGAIDLDMQAQETTVTVGAIIWATGWKPYDAAKIQPYGYDRYPNVITSVEFERMLDPFGPTGGKILRPSDGKEAKDVAFIQCAGSRDLNHLKHCSRICCMASLKQTTYLREQYGDDAKGTVYYIDIRAIDRIDDFYQNVQKDPNITFTKSKVANITQDKETGNPVLHGVDTEGYHRYSNPHELVVLAIGMEPSVPANGFPMDVVLNEEGFVELDEANGAFFAAGCSADALDVNRAVQSATASALRAIQVVNKVARAEG